MCPFLDSLSEQISQIVTSDDFLYQNIFDNLALNDINYEIQPEITIKFTIKIGNILTDLDIS